LEAPALVGIEACGNSQWFVDLLTGLGHEVWMGDAARIRACYVRKQKTDRRDAGHILQLLLEKRFPRLCVPTADQGTGQGGRAGGRRSSAGKVADDAARCGEDYGTGVCADGWR